MAKQGVNGIQWCDITWNPIRGCSIVSPGCHSCYAMRMAARFSGPRQPYNGLAVMTESGGRWTGRIRVVPRALSLPLQWREPQKIFVNSMSDLFHEGLSNDEILAVFGAMAAAPRHTFQVLTKRSARMVRWFEWIESEFPKGRNRVPAIIEHAAVLVNGNLANEKSANTLYRAANDNAGRDEWPLKNVWMGVSVEDQQRADERIPDLLKIKAEIRFLSIEPLLAPVSLTEWLMEDMMNSPPEGYSGSGIHWVIVGGESGKGFRPMQESWVESLRDQCTGSGVAFFYKQGSGIKPNKDPLLNGIRHAEFPK